MRLILIFVLMVAFATCKLPTARFNISFKGVQKQQNLLQNKAVIKQDQGFDEDYKQVDIDLYVDNGQKHLRSLLTCKMEKEHVDITLVKDNDRQTINIKLVPGKSTQFYVEDFPLDSVTNNEDNCEIILNSEQKTTKILSFAKIFLALILG